MRIAAMQLPMMHCLPLEQLKWFSSGHCTEAQLASSEPSEQSGSPSHLQILNKTKKQYSCRLQVQFHVKKASLYLLVYAVAGRAALKVVRKTRDVIVFRGAAMFVGSVITVFSVITLPTSGNTLLWRHACELAACTLLHFCTRNAQYLGFQL